MKTKEEYAEKYINYLYGEDKDELIHYSSDIHQTRQDFKAGFDLAEELFKLKWISAETPPDDERNVIIKIFDYRRPKEKVTEIGLGYYDHEEKEWYHTSDVLVNGGHGWIITHYMEIPQ